MFTEPAVLYAIMARLSDVTLTMTDRLALETNLGWKLMPGGVMFVLKARKRLCKSSKAMFDRLHILVNTGLLNTTIGLAMHNPSKFGINASVVGEYVNTFTWPR